MPLWETPDGMPPGVATLLHPGDSRIHHIATLKYGVTRGDFTPEPFDQVIELKITLFGQFRDELVRVLGIDQPGQIHSRSREKAQRSMMPYFMLTPQPQAEPEAG